MALKVETFFMLGKEFPRACFVWEVKLKNLHILVVERSCAPDLVISRVLLK